MVLERIEPGHGQWPGVHSLLRIAGPESLIWDAPAAATPGAATPGAVADKWIGTALRHLPFVVVRRNAPRPNLLPVGVRGAARWQRAPAWLPMSAMRECITPPMLVSQAAWRRGKHSGTAAIAILDELEGLLAAHGFAGCWGPGGSVGAELAGGVVCTTAGSDLDLVLYVESELPRRAARALHADLSALPVRIDALLETPHGGVALADYIGAAERMLLRTAQGPRLVLSPWVPDLPPALSATSGTPAIAV